MSGLNRAKCKAHKVLFKVQKKTSPYSARSWIGVARQGRPGRCGTGGRGKPKKRERRCLERSFVLVAASKKALTNPKFVGGEKRVSCGESRGRGEGKKGIVSQKNSPGQLSN